VGKEYTMSTQASSAYLSLAKLTRRLDLDSLRLLAMAAQFGSYARVAAEEPLTSSAISKRISDLERTLGTELLARTRTGVVLSASGQRVVQLWADMTQPLMGLAQLRGDRDERQRANKIVIADELSARYVRFDCLHGAAGAEDAPVLEIDEVPAPWLVSRFESTGASAAMWSLDEGKQPNAESGDAHMFGNHPASIYYTLVAPITVAAMRVDHPLAELESLAPSELLDFDIVCAGGFQTVMLKRLQQFSRETLSTSGGFRVVQPHWGHQVTSVLDHLDSMPTGVVALLPRSAGALVKRFPNVAVLPIHDRRAQMSFGCALRKGPDHQPLKALLERLTLAEMQPAGLVAA
jgi:DNA-binding transcriptional LysR family regulator